MPHKDPDVRAAYHREYAKLHKEKLKAYRNKYRSEHPENERDWQKRYADNSVEKRREYARHYRYGLTKVQFEEMLRMQNNSCAICKNTFTKTPHTDHCHTSGRVRGLLCGPCNTGLGVYEKKSTLFKRYLDEQQ